VGKAVTETKAQETNQWCFACGIHNPIGLKLSFREENDTYVTTFIPGEQHQGYDGIVHGGIVSTLLDEVMARYIYSKGYNAVTARLEVRFKKPTPIGEPLTVMGRIVGQRGNMFEMTGVVQLADGTITAQGKATVAVLED